MLTLEIPQQSKRLVLRFYKCVNPRLGIIAPAGLMLTKMYYVTWDCFFKKVIVEVVTTSTKTTHLFFLVFSCAEAIDSI